MGGKQQGSPGDQQKTPGAEDFLFPPRRIPRAQSLSSTQKSEASLFLHLEKIYANSWWKKESGTGTKTNRRPHPNRILTQKRHIEAFWCQRSKKQSSVLVTCNNISSHRPMPPQIGDKILTEMLFFSIQTIFFCSKSHTSYIPK